MHFLRSPRTTLKPSTFEHLRDAATHENEGILQPVTVIVLLLVPCILMILEDVRVLGTLGLGAAPTEQVCTSQPP